MPFHCSKSHRLVLMPYLHHTMVALNSSVTAVHRAPRASTECRVTWRSIAFAVFLGILLLVFPTCSVHAQVAPPPPHHYSQHPPPIPHPDEEAAILAMVSRAPRFPCPLLLRCSVRLTVRPHSCCAVWYWQINEESPSTLWYSSTGADAGSLTGLGAGRVPAHYHHMYYDGPAPHQHHASSYDEYANAAPAAAAEPAAPHFDEAEADPRAARRHAEGHMPPRPPDAYHYGGGGGLEDHGGWVHEVPPWMEKQGKDGWEEAERMMAGNTAEQKLRRQQRRAAQEDERQRRAAEQRLEAAAAG